jgi:hypothetical protein
MSAKKPAKRPSLQEEVANIERLSPSEIAAELKRYNIDPEPAIRNVQAMIHDKLAEWRRRGVLPAGKEVAHPTSRHGRDHRTR